MDLGLLNRLCSSDGLFQDQTCHPKQRVPSGDLQEFTLIVIVPIDLSRIPTNDGAESKPGWTKVQQLYCMKMSTPNSFWCCGVGVERQGGGGGVCSYALRGMQEVIFQKRVRVFHRGFKHEKTDESTRPQASCFYCVGVFETPMKHEVRVFEITSPTKEN